MKKAEGGSKGIQRWLKRQQRRLSGKMLGIGDGANDVAMIQAADVGIGIMGKEGRQVSLFTYSVFIQLILDSEFFRPALTCWAAAVMHAHVFSKCDSCQSDTGSGNTADLYSSMQICIHTQVVIEVIIN